MKEARITKITFENFKGTRITKITLENFKGIGARTEIPIAPLTLLFGGNSTGKSTVLHAIAYADEVLRGRNCNVDTTRLGGESLRLGGFDEIVHKHDKNATVKMRFDLDLSNVDLATYYDAFYKIEKFDFDEIEKFGLDGPTGDIDIEKGRRLFRETANALIDQGIGLDIKSAWVEFEVGYSKEYDPLKKLGPMVLSYKIGIDNLWIAEVELGEYPGQDGVTGRQENRKCFPAVLKKFNYLHPALFNGVVSCDGIGIVGILYPTLFPLLDQLYFHSRETSTSLLSRLGEQYGREARLDIVENKGGLAAIPEMLPEPSWKSLETDANLATVKIYNRKYLDSSTGKELDYEHWIAISYEKGELETIALAFRPEDGWNESLVEQARKTILTCSDLASAYEQDKVFFHGQVDAMPDPDDDFSIVGRGDYTSSLKRIQEQILKRLLCTPFNILRGCLSAFRYVGPIREILPWDYNRPFIRQPGRWANGLGAWDALSDPDDPLHESVTAWLSGETEMNTGYALRARNIREIPEDLQAKLLEAMLEQREELRSEIGKLKVLRKVDLLDLKKGGVPVHPQNVGVGISQLIPVLAAVLDQTGGSSCLLEQPELHLHPSQQAAVGDLLIHAAKLLNKTIIAESHSIHMGLRIQKRIRENFRKESKSPDDFTIDDFKILYVDSAGGTTKVEEIMMSPRGKLMQEWPDNLHNQEFDERMG